MLAFGKCTVDPSGPLKKLDLQHQGGQQAGQTVLAAYSLVDDVLTICTSSPGDGRPNELTSKAKPERALLIFKREKR